MVEERIRNVPRGLETHPAASHALRLAKLLGEAAEAPRVGATVGQQLASLRAALASAGQEAEQLARSLLKERR